jgi:glycerol-3-phosphate dehydrogenase (NAD(P)+)
MYLQRTETPTIAVLGAGAFGTALSISFSKFVNVSLFSGFSDHAEQLKSTRRNEFLPDFDIPSNVRIDVITNLNQHNYDYILWCFPVFPSVEILSKIRLFIKPEVFIIICSKGICPNGKFLRDAISEMLPNNDVGIMTGPNLAVDIASLRFSAAEIGFSNIQISEKICKRLSNNLFKLFPNNDVIGMQIAGTLKNIIAIACGICHGLDLGQNVLAALITKGLEEMRELGRAMNASERTFYGLAGIGDLVLTTSSMLSRNMTFGSRLAAGESPTHIKETSSAVSEGAECISNVIDICDKFETNSVICRTVYDIMNGAKKAENIIDAIR